MPLTQIFDAQLQPDTIAAQGQLDDTYINVVNRTYINVSDKGNVSIAR